MRAVLVGLLVAALVGGSYPYVVLKVGFGPNVSVVSALLGYLALAVIGFIASAVSGRDRRGNRFEMNIIQTAGTAAGQTAFMCVLLAAFDLLAARPELGFRIQPTALQTFLWLSVAGTLGVLLSVPMRRYFIEEEKLPFPDGAAAGETLLILDQDRGSARRRLAMLGLGGGLSAAITWLRDAKPRLIPESTYFGEALARLQVGVHWSALSFGSGLLVGLRISLSMGLGLLLSWVLLPGLLVRHGLIPEPTFAATLRWVMWPATGLMVAGGVAALFLKWRLVARSFQGLRTARAQPQSDFPLRWVLWGGAVLAVLLVAIQKVSLGIDVGHSLVALLVSVPMLLVGTRALGETNWAPISAMANMVQALFALLAPGHMGANMVASGMSATVATSGECLMQDYKTGHIIGSSNRHLTYMQLLATPVGALAVALVYPLLRGQYGIGPERFGLAPEYAAISASGLSSPVSVKWASFAELLASGFERLPPYSLHALGVASLVGVVITLLEMRFKRFVPSPTGIGLGMLVPATYVLPMVLGGIAQALWHRARAKSEEELAMPLASGLIVGEAMLALIIPLLVYFGYLAVAGGGR